MMSASHRNLEGSLVSYVSSSGRRTPDEVKFNSALKDLTSDEIFKLVSCTKSPVLQRTAVDWAAVKDHAWILRSILSSLKVKQRFDLLTLKSSSKRTVSLHLIAYFGSISALQYILDLVSPGERWRLMNSFHRKGSTPVLFAAWMGETEVMHLMLEVLTPAERFNILKVQNSYGNTAMHDAAQQGHTQTLKCIMDFIHPTVQSKLLEMQNLDNQTPLEFAECKENHDTADFIRQCIEAAGRHQPELPELRELVTQLREDKQVQAAQLEVKEQQLEEKEGQLQDERIQLRQLINVMAEQGAQNRQLTNELLKAKDELANQKEEENTKAAELREQLARKETEIQEAYNKMHSLLKQQMQGVVHRKDTDTNNSVQVEVDQKKKAEVVSRCERRVESTEHRMDSLKLPAAAVEETLMSENSCLEPVEASHTIAEGQLSITTTAMQVESESI